MAKLTNCKICGAQIAMSANTCPACGAKKKKPVYKKWWFWTIIILLLIIGNNLGGDGNDEARSADAITAETAQRKTEDASKLIAPSASPMTTVKPTPEATKSIDSNVTTGQKNALDSAKSYLKYSAFSYDGLVKQLEYEKYSNEDAVYAADNCGADWDEQALKSAKSYLEYSAFSYKGLIEQLEYEGFTNEQATYGADRCRADWNEQAVKSAESYLKYSSFSRDSLIDQLEYEGFTHEQAVYGAGANGY